MAKSRVMPLWIRQEPLSPSARWRPRAAAWSGPIEAGIASTKAAGPGPRRCWTEAEEEVVGPARKPIFSARIGLMTLAHGQRSHPAARP